MIDDAELLSPSRSSELVVEAGGGGGRFVVMRMPSRVLLPHDECVAATELAGVVFLVLCLALVLHDFVDPMALLFPEPVRSMVSPGLSELSEIHRFRVSSGSCESSLSHL
jgi:hypothetical protein